MSSTCNTNQGGCKYDSLESQSTTASRHSDSIYSFVDDSFTDEDGIEENNYFGEPSEQLLTGLAYELQFLEEGFKRRYLTFLNTQGSPKKDCEFKAKTLNYNQILTKTISDEALEIPNIPKENYEGYLDFLKVKASLSQEVYVMAFFYLERCLNNQAALTWVDPKCIKELYGICVLLAFKYLADEEFWPLSRFSSFVGISARTLYVLERQVLENLLEYSLYVCPQLFNNKLRSIKTTKY